MNSMHNGARRALVAATWGLWVVLSAAGCGRSGPERAAVAGSVTFGDAPLKAGRILFVPQPPLEADVVSAAIADGRYAIPEEAGPAVGRHRVEIDTTLDQPLDDEATFTARGGAWMASYPIPPQYNRASTLTAEIRSGDNRYDVTMSPAP